MPWYYVEAGAQKGPLDDAKFLELVANATIRADTLVWREGMKDWMPYASVAGAAGQAPAPVVLGPGMLTCGECGRAVPAAETVELGGRRICATCKPVVVQRMVEGTSSGGASVFDPEEMLADLRSRGGYTLDIGAAVSTGWDVVKGNFWPCVGVSFLIMVILGASGQVPCVGIIATLLITGPLTGGLFNYFLLQVRNQPATINDAFVGFKNPLGKELMLAGLVQQVIQVGVMMTTFIPFFATAVLATPGEPPDVPIWMVFAVPIAVLAVFAIYLIWYPSYVILADTGIGFWKGMELSRRLVMMRFFTWVGLVLTMVLIVIAGVLALCVGFFVALPVVNAAFAAAWEQVRSQAAEVKQSRVGVRV